MPWVNAPGFKSLVKTYLYLTTAGTAQARTLWPSGLASAVSVAAVLPQPARVPTASALIVRSAISLFFIMFLLLDAGSILFRADE